MTKPDFPKVASRRRAGIVRSIGVPRPSKKKIKPKLRTIRLEDCNRIGYKGYSIPLKTLDEELKLHNLGKRTKKSRHAVPDWKPSLDSYRDLVALKFSNEDWRRAADRLFSEELVGMPFDSLDSTTIAVPKEAIPFFEGLHYEIERMQDMTQLSQEEVNALRRERFQIRNDPK